MKCAAGRLHAADGRFAERHQCDALRQAQFQFHPRHRAGRRHRQRGPIVMVVNPSVPAKTVPEFIAYAKANPGKVNMASAGIGSAPHHGRRAVQDDGRHRHGPRAVSRRGPALTDLMGGQVQVMFLSMPASMEHVRAGKLRALAVTTATRWSVTRRSDGGRILPGYEASDMVRHRGAQTRLPRSSTSSTRRSTRHSPMPK